MSIDVYPEVVEPPFSDQIAQGLVPGTSTFFGFGEHSISGSSNNVDIWGGPTDTQPEPDTGGFALFVTSSSTSDDGDPAGVGAQTVHIHYLDTSGAEQSVSATLNGTTEVDTGVSDCMFVQQHHITAVGSNNVAVGDVDCLAGSGGAVISRVSAAGNQSMSTMKQVPAGCRLTVTGWHAYGVAGTTKIANIRIRSSAHDEVLNTGVYYFHDSARVKDSTSGEVPLSVIVPALAVIKISAWTTGTIDVGARWSGYIETI